jgi:hypothetical protein
MSSELEFASPCLPHHPRPEFSDGEIPLGFLRSPLEVKAHGWGAPEPLATPWRPSPCLHEEVLATSRNSGVELEEWWCWRWF